MNKEIPKEVLEYITSLSDSDELIDAIEKITSKKQKSVKDWYNEFAKAEIRGYFPDHCEKSAYNWGCCAIGARLQIENPELAKEISLENGSGSLKKKGYYLTDEAYELGIDFMDAIEEDDVVNAKQIFNKIHSLTRIFKTDEEVKYMKLPFYKKWFNRKNSFTLSHESNGVEK